MSLPTILVANDDDASRYAIVRILRRGGFDTIEARDGLEALAKAAETPDLALLDVNMPGLDGYQVCERLQREPATRTIPVVMLTAQRQDDGSRVDGLQRGAIGYLNWPIQPAVLIAYLHSIHRASRETHRLTRWVETCTPLTGDAFHRAAAEFLARELDADLAIIGRIDPENPDTVHTLAAWCAGEMQPLLDFPLDGTPCARLAEQGFCAHQDGVCELFPQDKILTELEARGYAGVPLRDRDGRCIGLAAVAFREPLSQPALAERILRLVADRAESELVRSRSEELLHTQQERLERAVQSGSVGLWDWDIATGALDWNDQVKHIFGFPLDSTDIRLEQYIAAIYPDDAEETQRCFQQALEDHTEYRSEHRIVRPDGDVRWILAIGRGVYDPDGKPTHLRGAVVDITDRKEAEAGLREQLEWNRTMLRTMVDGYILADLQGRILETNPSYRNMVGYSEEELVGRNIRDIEAALDPDEVTERIETFKRDGHASFETSHRHKDGHEVHLQVGTNLVGTPPDAHVAAFVRDITDRKKAEIQISRLNRTYAVLSDINQLIVRERDEHTLLQGACDIAHSPGGFALAWIGRTNEEGRLRVAAHAGITPEVARALRNLVEADSPSCPNTFEALSTGRVTVANDIASDPRTGPWQEAALANGYHSMISLPIKVAGAVVGTFNLYSAVSGFFDPSEVELLDELASDIGFALETVRLEKERQRAELQQREVNAILEAIALDEPLQEILARTASAIETLQPGLRAVIHILGDDRRLHLAAAPSLAAETAASLALLQPRADAFETDTLTPDTPAKRIAPNTLLARPDDHPLPADLDSGWWKPIRSPQGEPLAALLLLPATDAPASEPQPDIAATFTQFAGIAIQRHNQQTSLRHSEERFRELAESIHEVFWVINPRTRRRLYVSPAFETIWGHDCADLYHNPQLWLECIHPDDQPRVRHASETRATTGDYNETYRITRPDGETRWIHDQAYPVHDDHGEVVRVVGVARDITDQRQLEEQLRQSQKLDAVGQLAGGIAHDFNNILAAILMQTSIVAENEELPTEVRDGIAEITGSARRAADLVRQLLLFSRRQVLRPRQINLNEAIRSLANMLSRVIRENINLEFSLTGAPLWVNADPAMIDQILVNLTVNARDAMPEGGSIMISTQERILTANEISRYSKQAAAGPYAIIRITDTGCGIAPEVMPKIFDPFFTTKEPGKGTGLGLATTFGIVRQHEGWIHVESQPGQGTTFTIGLPRSEGKIAAAAESKKEETPRGRNETILLVEDHEGVRNVTRMLLTRYGFRVLEATDGNDAIKVWQQHLAEIRLVLTDLVMPGDYNGARLVERLRHDRPGIPVIYTSGYTDEVSTEQEAGQPATAFIPKPCPPNVMLKMVRELLDRSGIK